MQDCVTLPWAGLQNLQAISMLKHTFSSHSAPKRVVVVGGNGFVGGAIVERLRSEKIPVVSVTRGDVNLLETDAADRLAALFLPDDAVVAASAMAPCVNSQMLVDNTNIMRAITDALAKRPVAHVVNISSDAVYADSVEPLTESSVVSPASIHGVMHLAREILFRSAVTGPLVILRPTLIYGPADTHNGYGPNRFIRLAKEGNQITLFGKGEERRDHVFIDDVAELAVRTVRMRSEGELNVATGMVHSFREIADRVMALGHDIDSLRFIPRMGAMPHNGYRPFDPSATYAAFPDFAYTQIDQGLSAAWEHMETFPGANASN